LHDRPQGGQNGHFSPAWRLGLRTYIFSARVTNAPECQISLMQASFHAV